MQPESLLNPDSSRTRAVAVDVPSSKPNGDPLEKIDRVWFIAESMALGVWERGEKELRLQCADTWGISPETVETYACHAKMLMDMMGDTDRLEMLTRSYLVRFMSESKPDRVSAAATLLKNLGRDGRQHEREQERNIARDPQLRKKIVATWANPNNAWAELIEAALIKARDKGGRLRGIVERVFGVATQGVEVAE